MKTGLTMQELATEVKRQETIKNDYIADTNGLESFVNNDGNFAIRRKSEMYDIVGSTLTKNAHSQVAARLKIHKTYYDRLLEDYPHMLALNVNNLFDNEPEKRMLRLLDGRIRAFLSDSYQIRDNWELMSAILPVLYERPDAKVESCNVNENKLYVKVILHEMTGTLATGDIVKSGIVISNSEIGQGSLRIEPFTYVLYCSNGMISARSIKKYHVGAKQGNDDEIWQVLSDETKKMDQTVFFEKIKDVVRASFTDVDFATRIQEINDAQEHRVSPRKLEGTVKAIQKKYGIIDAVGENILEQIINGKEGLTLWGVSQAITNVAQSEEIDYEMATTMERAGGAIVEMGGAAFDRMIKQLSK